MSDLNLQKATKAGPFKGTKPSEKEGRHNPKYIGEIPGYPVGSKFINRADLSGAGVHGPLRAGIHGNREDGAYSVVLSHGYEDDEDNGETFIYTGHGGRKPDSSTMDQMMGKESWSNHQASDQEWKFGNKALQISWMRGTPVRVIRGAPRNRPELFKYAPAEGLRYDGLYQVIHAWKDEGVTGFQTCKFLFSRLPDQLPLPGGHAIASSSKNPLELLHIKSTKSSSKPAINPPRAPVVPRPPYRPSEADIAKLRSNSRSSTTKSTPKYTDATSNARENTTPSLNRPNSYPWILSSYEVDAKGKDIDVASSSECAEPALYKSEPASPILPAFSRSPSSDLGVDDDKSRKRLGSPDRWRWRDDDSDFFVEPSDEEESLGMDVWATVRGKQKLPASLSFKKQRVE